MKMSKKLLTSGVAAVVAAMAAGSMSANAAEVAASAAVANMYLWRGNDLGNGKGVPAVSGDIKVTESGFTVGAWGSSGDEAAGTEYDLWVGYGGAAGDFRYDLTIWTYVYPSAGNSAEVVDDGELVRAGSDDTDNIGDLSEAVLTLSYGPVTFMYYDNIAGAPEYYYYTLGAAFGSFSALVGYAINGDAFVNEDGSTDDVDYTHLDVSYAYNENVSFTLSQVVDEGPDDSIVDDDLKFVVKYSLPIK